MRVGPAHPIPIWLNGRRTPARAHLVVDDELVDGIGVRDPRDGASAAPRSRRGELTRRGVGIVRQPSPELAPGRMVVSGQGEVHGEAA